MDPPEKSALEDALRDLYFLEAIDSDGKITEMGMFLVYNREGTETS